MIRAEPGFSLPAFDRLAPPPPPELVAARIDAHTAPGDVVVDLHGRGAWVARAAVDRQRSAVSFEATPLNRLLAEVVLRPPDVRHLDAAFQALSARPEARDEPEALDQRPVRDALRDLRASDRPRRGRPRDGGRRALGPAGPQALPLSRLPRPARRGRAAPGAAGRGRREARPMGRRACPRRSAACATRFPVPEGGDALVADILALHTPRQLDGLVGILERIDADLRAEPVEAALRLALVHALVPASRLNTTPGRGSAVRDRVRPGPAAERRPVAREEPVARLRGCLPHRPGLRPPSRGVAMGPGPGATRRRTCAASSRARRPCRSGSARRRRSAAWPPRPASSPGRAPAGRPGSVSSSASPRSDRTPSGSRSATSPRPGCSGGRPRRCCRSSRCSTRPSAPRGPGRRPPSGARWNRSSRFSPATDGRSCWSTPGAPRP